MTQTPEQKARIAIDQALEAAGWAVQDATAVNLSASRGVAIREFPLKSGFGHADYLLYVDGKAAGVIEAKKEGATLTGVELQAAGYSQGLPEHLPAHLRPLPFLYQSTGVETRFTNRLDPEPRSRRVFHFHRPESLAGDLAAEPLWLPDIDGRPHPRSALPSTLRGRLQALPQLSPAGLWPAQFRAVRNLETSLHDNRPRALLQMATGSGKTMTAISSIYRLIKFAEARRVLFLVDRANLGRQALKEFQQFTAPDDGRKFTELYNVQHLTSNRLDPVARVVVTTIQRLYSMLRGEPELDPTAEEGSLFDSGAPAASEPVPIGYNQGIPVEFFDVVFIDECHRSIYTLWRQVLEYFDAFLVGLTATPSKQTFGFFDQNLVMEYHHEQAVADGVNVDFDVYRIRTRITAQGSRVEAGHYVDKRSRDTRLVRWEKLDEDLAYQAEQLDRQVVTPDQIRTVIRTFRDRLFTEIFPGRKDVPKTLIYAKDDSHADDIVQIAREEFGKGNDFCWKITYRTTGRKPEDLLQEFRNSYDPRIIVTVDMIATGTDIKPLEIVMFLRAVKSRNFFEQMKGRGVRVIDPTDLQSVTPGARAKTHFVIVDAVGVCEQELVDTRPLEKQRSVAFEKLLQSVAFGSTDPQVISSLASRLARLDRMLGRDERKDLASLAGGRTLHALASDLIEALDPDRQAEAARRAEGLPAGAEPSAQQVAKAAAVLSGLAVAPFRDNPALRERLSDLKRSLEQTIDTVSRDELLEAGFSADAAERARSLVGSFERFIAEHKDEITALQILYSQPYARRLRYGDIKALAAAIGAPPRSWTAEGLWRAYEALDRARVRGAGGRRLLTDIVSLVRFALRQDDELVPFEERVQERFTRWLAQQGAVGREFTAEQLRWLELMRDHIGASVQLELEDFEAVPFNQLGGLGRVYDLFGQDLGPLLEELNEVLAA